MIEAGQRAPAFSLPNQDGERVRLADFRGEKSLYGRKSMGVIRSTVVIDRAGKVARHWPKVRVKGHVEEVVETVRGLARGA